MRLLCNIMIMMICVLIKTKAWKVGLSGLEGMMKWTSHIYLALVHCRGWLKVEMICDKSLRATMQYGGAFYCNECESEIILLQDIFCFFLSCLNDLYA